jgi:1-deoxypentalenic acid 11beta-hydroxylase
VRLDELRPANDLLDNPLALAERHARDGCLFMRGAFDPALLADVTEQATSRLRLCGLARKDGGLSWTGAKEPHVDETGIHEIPALDDLVAQIDRGSDPLRRVANRVCGRPMRVWRGLLLFAGLPDDPSLVSAPHQDNFAVDSAGDYRRLWIALTEIPFGDGGLGVALGSHRLGRLPLDDLADFSDRPGAGDARVPRRAKGVDPRRVEDRWFTAGMQPGDLLVFRPDVVHRGLPGTSDRIRLALAVIVWGEDDPVPKVLRTSRENRARLARVRELAAPLGLADHELFRISADLGQAELAVNDETVRAAARGEYARR